MILNKNTIITETRLNGVSDNLVLTTTAADNTPINKIETIQNVNSIIDGTKSYLENQFIIINEPLTIRSQSTTGASSLSLSNMKMYAMPIEPESNLYWGYIMYDYDLLPLSSATTVTLAYSCNMFKDGIAYKVSSVTSYDSGTVRYKHYFSGLDSFRNDIYVNGAQVTGKGMTEGLWTVTKV